MVTGMMGTDMYGMSLGMGITPFNPMMNQSYLNFSDNQDMTTYYNTQIDNMQVGVYSNGQGRLSQRAQQLAQQLQGAIASGKQTEVGNILQALENDPHLLAGVERCYDNLAGARASLRKDVRTTLAGSQTLDRFHLGFINDLFINIRKAVMAPFGYDPMSEREAIDILNKGAAVDTVVAANALKDATCNGLALDTKTVDTIQAMSKGRSQEINASYSQMGSNLSQDVRNSYINIIDGFGSRERVNGNILNELV